MFNYHNYSGCNFENPDFSSFRKFCLNEFLECLFVHTKPNFWCNIFRNVEFQDGELSNCDISWTQCSEYFLSESNSSFKKATISLKIHFHREQTMFHKVVGLSRLMWPDKMYDFHLYKQQVFTFYIISTSLTNFFWRVLGCKWIM